MPHKVPVALSDLPSARGERLRSDPCTKHRPQQLLNEVLLLPEVFLLRRKPFFFFSFNTMSKPNQKS